jgi:hypothetical protein
VAIVIPVTITNRGKESAMHHTTRTVLTIGLLALLVVAPVVLAQPPAAPPPASTPTGEKAARFDYLVRADFFAGMRGDRARFERAMRLCEETLAREPRHAEAMVWYGSGLLVLAGQSFRSGDAARGRELWERGLGTMADAVALAPDRVAVLIPRGATLLLAARQIPPGAVVGDTGLEQRPALEKALALQTPYFERLSLHARGELLAGLVEGWHQLGRDETARAYLERMVAELDGSGYQARAKAWLETGPPLGGFACASVRTLSQAEAQARPGGRSPSSETTPAARSEPTTASPISTATSTPMRVVVRARSMRRPTRGRAAPRRPGPLRPEPRDVADSLSSYIAQFDGPWPFGSTPGHSSASTGPRS